MIFLQYLQDIRVFSFFPMARSLNIIINLFSLTNDILNLASEPKHLQLVGENVFDVNKIVSLKIISLRFCELCYRKYCFILISSDILRKANQAFAQINSLHIINLSLFF